MTTTNFAFTDVSNVHSGDVDFTQGLQPAFNPLLVNKVYSAPSGIGTPLELINRFKFETTRVIDTVISTSYGMTTKVDTSIGLVYKDKMTPVSAITSARNEGVLSHVDVTITTKPAVIGSIDVPTTIAREKVFVNIDTKSTERYTLPPTKDITVTEKFNSVAVYVDKAVRPDYRYFPTADFVFTGEGNKFTANFVNPLNFDKVKTRLSPVDSGTRLDSNRVSKNVDCPKRLGYGYGLNNFVIGGIFSLNNDVDNRPPPKDTIIHPDYEVFKIVNIVNMVTLPDRTPVMFDDFSLVRDVDSFVWTVNFKPIGEAAYDLVKPVGRNLKQIEIDINGMKINVFVGRTGRSIEFGRMRYTATAWSDLKLLSFPYHRTRSHTETSSKTAAQLVGDELLGSAITVNWDTVDWAIPTNVFGYQDKTPIGAILDLTNAAGAVIEPHLQGGSIRVRPRFPVSPWNWDNAETVPDHTISTSQFLTIDSDVIPKSNPDKIFTYGEEQGAAAAVVKQGTAGTNVLPDVVDQYLTTADVCRERGRIEIAKNSFLVDTAMTTYVDTATAIFLPLDLIEFTEQDGSKWRGMVSSTSIVCKRVGTALIQSLNVLRYYDE